MWLRASSFLNSTGHLVEDICPQSPHVPLYWSIPKSKQTFCFSQTALDRTDTKIALRSVAGWQKLVHDFSATWRFLGFIHNNDQCVTKLPPPGFAKTRLRLHTEHGICDVMARKFEEKVQREAGLLPSGCKMRLVPKANLSFSQFCAQPDTSNEPSEVSLSYTWQTQKDVPLVVRDNVLKWEEGVVLDQETKRLIPLHVQCADKNPHMWFCPPAPEIAEEA